MIIVWLLVFILSLAVLIKSADWLLDSSEKIGLRIGMSPFIIGVTIVAFGTSLPELISSFVAVFAGIPDFPVANAVGSNIANILLVIGIATLFAKKLQVTKDLIDLDLPLLAISTSIFLVVVWDGSINFFESLFLLATYIIYLGFSLIYKDDESGEKVKRPKITNTDLLKLVVGTLGLALGARFLISSVEQLALIFDVAAGVIAITAVALGTSLPEILVSVKAAMKRQSEVALGNIFGSNIFNILVVVGLPGIFGELLVDSQTLLIGLPVLVIATILFVISGISRRVHVQEGALYLLLYVVFISKLFNLF
jgi:cation:H+ antiporter